ncbi:hypothetical protein GSbR_18680 [Geobacter sp. SVR]|nr:hypothetical protein GSVR_33950 [Geobacter sp. SVR]GCF85268.1 hypothetical protein GSbR_18680 [Geobacter sp. SVR]
MKSVAEHTNAADTAENARYHNCKHLKKPFPECYCMNISSIKIAKILSYCASDYESCHIYRTRNETKK